MYKQPVEIESEVIEKAVEVILESPVFRSSKQCQLLLRYIVDHSLSQETNLLRERIIGANVFGRALDYDTGNDPIVRSRAGEVRKRLAQYYAEHRNDTAVYVSIPSGSYRAVFSIEDHSNAQVPERSGPEVPESTLSFVDTDASNVPEITITPEKILDAAQNANTRLGWRLGLSALVCIIVLSGSFMAAWLRRVHEQVDLKQYQQFWAPITSSPKNVILYIGANYSYRLSAEYLEQYRQTHHLENNGPEFFVDFRPSENILEKDLIPTNNFIGFGDVAATSRVIAMLTRFGKQYDLRYGDDISVTDLQSSPVFLIGGFSNPWALKLMDGLRFTLSNGDRIVDGKDRSRVFQVGVDSVQSDYVVISRIVQPKADKCVVVIAGIGSGSNQAAADFLSDPQQLGKVLLNAPTGWEKMNLQIVLHANILKGVPISSDVQAVDFAIEKHSSK